MLEFVVSLIVIAVACVAVYRITFGDADQPATAPKQRHRTPSPDGSLASAPASLVPGPDPTKLDPDPVEVPPATGLVDDIADDMAAADVTASARDGDDGGDATRAIEVGTALPAPPTVELRPADTQPLPDPAGVVAAGSDHTLVARLAPHATGHDDTVAVTRPRAEPTDDAEPTAGEAEQPAEEVERADRARRNGVVPFPTPGAAELVPAFGSMLLPWPTPAVAVEHDEPARGADRPVPAPTEEATPPTELPASDVTEPLTTPTDQEPATDVTEPVTTPAEPERDATEPMAAPTEEAAPPEESDPTPAATPAATLTAAPAPPTGARRAPARGTTATAAAPRSRRTVVVARQTGGQRLRSTLALLVTVTFVGVLLAMAVGLSIVALGYLVRAAITG